VSREKTSGQHKASKADRESKLKQKKKNKNGKQQAAAPSKKSKRREYFDVILPERKERRVRKSSGKEAAKRYVRERSQKGTTVKRIHTAKRWSPNRKIGRLTLEEAMFQATCVGHTQEQEAGCGWVRRFVDVVDASEAAIAHNAVDHHHVDLSNGSQVIWHCGIPSSSVAHDPNSLCSVIGAAVSRSKQQAEMKAAERIAVARAMQHAPISGSMNLTVSGAQGNAQLRLYHAAGSSLVMLIESIARGLLRSGIAQVDRIVISRSDAKPQQAMDHGVVEPVVRSISEAREQFARLLSARNQNETKE